MLTRSLDIPTAEVFEPLLAPARHKAAWGGRGSGKSYFFASQLIRDSMLEPGLLSVCIREVQKDLKDSSKRLIEKLLIDYRLGEADGFKVFRERIETPGDGQIIFTGMQDHTSESIKSLEGFKRAWWEEAQAASRRSIDLLTPTIRAKGSQLWWSWNARLKNDPVDRMFRGEQIPTGAVVVRANYTDNPWFNDDTDLEQERLDCLRMQPDQYAHIWEGEYLSISAGAYYAASLTAARKEGRIAKVSADPLMTYRAFWDIGGTGAKADACAIWVAQFVGREIRLLNYYEAVGQPLATHVAWLRENGYGKALCVLPHDGSTHDKVYDVSYESSLQEAGFETSVIPNQGKGAASARIESGRRLFTSCWFNEPTTTPGIDALGWYHEKKDDKRNLGLGPEHDWCLAANTKVLTPNGWSNVQDIVVHDEVLTPTGTRRIMRSGIVRRTNEWTTVKGIRCTPEHRFFTSRGLVEAGELLPQESLWTQDSLGLRFLAFLCVIFRLGLKTAITSATQEGKLQGARYSFIAWYMRIFMAKYRQTMKSIISTIIRLIITPITFKPCPVLSIAVATSHSLDLCALVGYAAKSSDVTRSSGLDAARNARRLTTLDLNESAAPAYNLTVDIDECYFVRGDDGLAYLVSNSSHGADAFGLMCVAYEAPRIEKKARPRMNAGTHGWMA